MDTNKTVEKTKERQAKKLLGAIVFAVIAVPIVKWRWPGVIPFTYAELLLPRGSGTWQCLIVGLPLILWGTAIAAMISFTTKNTARQNKRAEMLFVVGLLMSLWTGLSEEFTTRWLLLFGNIAGVEGANFLLFDWAGFGLVEWLELHAYGPVANFFTLGVLAEYLIDADNWAIGGGILIANGLFRDGHKYQGTFLWTNSWFAGMFLFYVLFLFGLPCCIAIHFMHNSATCAVRYVDSIIEREQGRRKSLKLSQNGPPALHW